MVIIKSFRVTKTESTTIIGRVKIKIRKNWGREKKIKTRKGRKGIITKKRERRKIVKRLRWEKK